MTCKIRQTCLLCTKVPCYDLIGSQRSAVHLNRMMTVHGEEARISKFRQGCLSHFLDAKFDKILFWGLIDF